MVSKLKWIPLVAASVILAGDGAAAPAAGEGQLGQPIEWIPDPGDLDRVWMAQKSRDGRLILTPNEAFFPKRGLKAEGKGSVPDVAELNGGNSFAEIRGWDEGDQAEWGLWFPRAGEIEVKGSLKGSERFSIGMGEEPSETLRDRPVTLRINEPGRYSLRVTCESGGSGAALEWIEISGEPAKEGAVIRKRWRPAAAHTKFLNSREPKQVRLWIMELDAQPGDLGFYCPVTTPFGYYGPTWNADGTVNTSFNFSLWSFGRNESEPPVEQLSHLIAIGNPEASFGGFDHEGTGVKIRNWEPLEGRQGQSQAIALRVEPGEKYDTYFSYFFAADEKRWRLFGAGKKFNKGKPVESLWVGSFVEVPGPPPVQRTGPYERRMRYRGWVMDNGGRWYPLDRMTNGNVDRETGFTHTDRGTTEDGWFFLQTGGWTFRKPPNRGNDVSLKAPSGKPRVDFLDPDDLEFLKTIPCGIEVTEVERNRDRARVSFTLRNAGDDAEVSVYWGSGEGLTFFERWEKNARIPGAREGSNQHVIEGVDADAPLRVRLFLKNDEGQFWSAETAIAVP